MTSLSTFPLHPSFAFLSAILGCTYFSRYKRTSPFCCLNTWNSLQEISMICWCFGCGASWKRLISQCAFTLPATIHPIFLKSFLEWIHSSVILGNIAMSPFISIYYCIPNVKLSYRFFERILSSNLTHCPYLSSKRFFLPLDYILQGLAGMLTPLVSRGPA